MSKITELERILANQSGETVALPVVFLKEVVAENTVIKEPVKPKRKSYKKRKVVKEN